MTKHVAVLMGGWSSERPVSLNSGKACADALEERGYRVTRIDVDRGIGTLLDELRPDVCFNALHGPYGEDGTIQGILEILDIPYTHSGVLASALAMNKPKAKHVLKAAGIPVVEHALVNRFDAVKAHVLKPPYVVKPPAEGSSFGVLIVPADSPAPPQQLGTDAWPYGDNVMVERYIPGRELTCGVMGDDALGIIEVVPTGEGFYDYDAKYRPGGSRHILPAPLSPFIYQNVQRLALEAHRALGCRGVSRADFRFDDRGDGTGEVYCLEVNTQPGMTATSLVPEMAAHAGIEFGALVSWIVEDASCKR
ncbi:D-alanine--D-alanine ligase [Oharaeibacter diazotrophicus]|uniref:D-alanine--D-alanine ligase n=1 Tax=Oharaeibacter diazotrophicus TaxID=1920512 RepID=A0A4R6RGT6_9HYPH|nr:D-alanine--D-alanine ligase [Oharaeibacter diazotrophicus]TDP85540.1 D-alanine-D-alanine ligase [Oharaeibacter diazotrophicus]BBE74511.1 D-alanine-D-alanine ligase B [Pleomorphomonas sp. SM30]GLS75790.1 D-alanine--D-alanine ligase [Oharaeibacter diazotrophicus]